MNKLNSNYRVVTQELVVSGLRSLLENQIRIESATYPSFTGLNIPFKLLQITITPENKRVNIDRDFLSFVCGTDLISIGASGRVFEGNLKGETFVIIIDNEGPL